MKVKATRRGYYGSMVRDPGDEFVLKSKDDLGSWMQPIEAPKAEPKAEPKPKRKSAKK